MIDRERVRNIIPQCIGMAINRFDVLNRKMPKFIFTKEDKYSIERIIAATFISEKIGYTFKLNQLILKRKGFDITANYYTNNMTSVIRNVYRKIQEFMFKECKRKVKPISVDQFTILRSPLIQVREWLYADQLLSFFKFVRLTYNINGDVDIKTEEAIKLYGQIMLTLQKQCKMDMAHLKKNRNKTTPRREAANYLTYRTFEKTS